MAAVVQQPSYKQIVLRLRELIKYFGSLTMAGPHDLARIAFDSSVNPFIKSVTTKHYVNIPMEYYSVTTHAHGEWQIPMFPLPVYVQSFDGAAQVTLIFPNSRLRDHVYTFDVANSRFVGASPVFEPSLQTSTPVSGAAPPRFPDLSGVMCYWHLPSNHELLFQDPLKDSDLVTVVAAAVVIVQEGRTILSSIGVSGAIMTPVTPARLLPLLAEQHLLLPRVILDRVAGLTPASSETVYQVQPILTLCCRLQLIIKTA